MELLLGAVDACQRATELLPGTKRIECRCRQERREEMVENANEITKESRENARSRKYDLER